MSISLDFDTTVCYYVYMMRKQREIDMIGTTLEFNYGAMFAPEFGTVTAVRDDGVAEVFVDGFDKEFMDLVDTAKIKTWGIDTGVGVYFDVA